jgi:hypothetical protein
MSEDTDGSSPPPATSTVEQGNLPAALESFRASFAIRERLAKVDRGNAGGRVISQRVTASSDMFRKGRAIVVPLVAAAPGHAQWKAYLAPLSKLDAAGRN